MSKVYFNGAGITTEPEVNDLIEKIGVPKPGDQISYIQVSEIIKVKRGTGRWHSIVGAWRKRLDNDHNILFKAISNEGFLVLDNAGRVTLGADKFKGGLRRIGRASSIVTRTDRTGLTEEEKRVADHIQRTGATLRLTAQTAARELKYPD
jgi:hypothetical protein